MSEKEALDWYKKIRDKLLDIHEDLSIFLSRYSTEIFSIGYYLRSLNELIKKSEGLDDKDFFYKVINTDEFWRYFVYSSPSSLIIGVPFMKVGSEIIEQSTIDVEIRNRLKEINRKVDERLEDPLFSKIRKKRNKIYNISHGLMERIEKIKRSGRIYDELLIEYFLEHE